MVKKSYRSTALLLSGLIAGATLSGTSLAAESSSVLDMIDFYGDFRFRFEQDWDSSRSDGSERSDRARARIRGRIGLKITPNEFFEINTRLRTGAKDSQQSPHWTIADFSGNSTGTHAVVFDKWYGKLKKDHLWVWGGRNGLPIWKQNELLWDDDVTVIGGATGIKDYQFGAGKFSVNAGYVRLPDGMRHNHGDMPFAQLVYSTRLNNIALTVAGGLLALDGDSSTPDVLRQGNGNRDYTIWVGNLQARTEISGLPVSLGFDVMHNSEDYSVAELAGTPAGTTDDDTDGYVIQVRLGKNSNQGDWLIGYSYADIETLAVNASYAQDDWMRWGSSTQTDASDFHGHEFRAAYVLPGKIKVLARFYSVESNNNPQDGNRFRIDFNKKF